ncbi:MAG: CBM96 family carbohydrate-binding protein, partial [Candidatus Thorarchaeota archaeon]
MKRYSLILVAILILGMVVPIIPIATSNYSSEGIVDEGLIENTLLSANGESAVTVIKVSDDAPVGESAPDTNWDDDSGGVILSCSNWSGDISRSWLKFNLTHLPDNLHFTRATVNLIAASSVNNDDYPRGIYFSENDTWTEETITWNNQPEYNAIPAAVIDSPASPNMFEVGYWYEWEITAEVIQTLEQDGMLTLVLALADEDASGQTNLGFSSREYGIILGDSGFNAIPYVSLEYEVPTTTDLLVDGFSESPQIDYINSANPEFSWTFNDADPNDIQKNFELEVWNNSAFDDTLLMHDGNTEVSVVHDTAGAGTSSLDTFNLPMEVRTQYKWPASMITQSGVVDKLYFEMDVISGTTTYNDLAIYILCVEDSSDLTTDYQSNYDGRTPIQVLNRSEYTAITEDGFMVFDIENTFIVESDLNLIIEFRHTGASGTSATSNYTYSGGSWAINSGSGAYRETTALGTEARTFGLRMEMVSEEILSGGPMSNTFPFGLSPGTSGRFQFKYNQSLIGTSGVIDRILFPVTGVGNVIFENFSVYLVETPLLGELSHTDMDSNYGGQVPILVVDRDDYVIRNSGHMLVIDVDNLFYYTNTHDLLIELRFDSLVSGSESVTFVNG